MSPLASHSLARETVHIILAQWSLCRQPWKPSVKMTRARAATFRPNLHEATVDISNNII